MRTLGVILGLLLLVCSAWAQQAHVARDSSEVQLRTLPPEALDRYRDDPAFDYDQAPPTDVPWWQRIWNWFVENVLKPIFGRVPGKVYEWLIYLVAAALVFFAVTRLLRMSPRGLFTGKSDRPRVAFSEIEGDIAAMDFDRLIDEAMQAGDFRRAVRLHYLRVLQTLTARGLIDWQIDKTNEEYVAELTEDALRSSFAELTRRFEYVWYGDFPLDEAAFARTSSLFAKFENDLAEPVAA